MPTEVSVTPPMAPWCPTESSRPPQTRPRAALSAVRKRLRQCSQARRPCGFSSLRSAPLRAGCAVAANAERAPLKVYDPYVEKDLVPNQYHDLDAFLSDVDLVVVMVGHRQIVEAQEKLAGKTVLDCRHVLSLPGVHQL